MTVAERLRHEIQLAIEKATEAGLPPKRTNEILLELVGENSIVEAAQDLGYVPATKGRR